MSAYAATLSDKTSIGNNTWALLKEEAMQNNYDRKGWFRSLNPQEKEMLEALRQA